MKTEKIIEKDIWVIILGSRYSADYNNLLNRK